MSLADYLAKNYLNADPVPEKKSKKRKRKEATTGIVIADDGAANWARSGGGEDLDLGPTVGTQ